jgi:tRNA-guanine transglycosylase
MQEAIGADIMFAFDECTPPLATREYIVASLERTHRWEARSRAIHTDGSQALFGIVQGSHFKDLRKASAMTIRALGFEGYGIGGDLGKTKADMRNILRWTMPYLEEQKPRHLLGVGYLEDIERIIKEGVDLFDCTAPSHNARHGIAYTSHGTLHIRRRKFLTDAAPLDRKCGCETCARYTRAFLSHLFRAKEMTGMTALTIHNLWFFNNYVAGVRKKIAKGLL